MTDGRQVSPGIDIEQILRADVQVPADLAFALDAGGSGEWWQSLTDLDLLSSHRMDLLGREVAAVHNSALLARREFGYLFWDLKDCLPSVERAIGGSVPECAALTRLPVLDQVFSDRVGSLVSPAPSLVLSSYCYQNRLILRVNSRHDCPVIARFKDSKGEVHSGAELWKDRDGWRVRMATPGDMTRLYELHLDSECRLHPGCESQEIQALFANARPASPHEYATFITGLLIRAAMPDRAMTASCLMHIGGLSDVTRHLIAQLLISLVGDEKLVALEALNAVRALGDHSHAERILRTGGLGAPWEETDDELLETLFEAVAQLGSPSAIRLIGSVYHHLTTGRSRRAAVQATSSLCFRYGVEKFDAVARSSFMDLVRSCHFREARALLGTPNHVVCRSEVHSGILHCLLRYGEARKRHRFDDAISSLHATIGCDADAPEELMSVLDEAERTLPPLSAQLSLAGSTLSPTARVQLSKVAESYYQIQHHAFLLAEPDLLNRLYALFEKLYLLAALVCGIPFSQIGLVVIDENWLIGSQAQALKVRGWSGVKAGTKMTRSKLQNLLRAIAKEGAHDYCALVLTILEKWERIVELRNRSMGSHGDDPSTAESELSEFESDIRTLIADLGASIESLAGVSLGQNPYDALHSAVQWVVSDSDGSASTYYSLMNSGPEHSQEHRSLAIQSDRRHVT